MVDCRNTPVENCQTCTPICDSLGAGVCDKPGWSLYDINPNNCEHRLFESSLCEIVDIAGYPIEYRCLLPKNEWLWGEDPNSRLSYPTYTKVIYAPDTSSNLLDLFGLVSDETIQYMFIPMATFKRDMAMLYSDTFGPDIFVKPRVGDVIKTLWNNFNYEVVSISEEDDVFMAKKFTYSLILRPFRFSEQSSEHRVVHTSLPDDPFSNIVPGPSGQDIMQFEGMETLYGDNAKAQTESDGIYNYDDEGPMKNCPVDPDIDAFGR